MSDKNSNQNIKELISKSLNINIGDVTDTLSYRDISEWDSLQHVNLMMGISEIFNIRLSSDDIKNLTSVKKIIDFIQNNKEKYYNDKTNLPLKLYRGLADIYYDNSTITCIDQEAGKLCYRGFDINDLIEYSNFDETTFLILNNRLPLSQELENFKNNLFSYIDTNKKVIEFVDFHKKLSPLQLIKSIINSKDIIYSINVNMSMQEQALFLWINVITCLGIQRALIQGKEFKVKKSNSFSEFCYYMLFYGENDNYKVDFLDKDLILHADHESNASTFVARIAASAKGDISNAILSAISTFEGELHGGALDKVNNMFDNMLKEADVENYIKYRLQAKMPIYGYGHRVYKTINPRAKVMKTMLDELGVRNNNIDLYKLVGKIDSIMEKYKDYGLAPNVDFYAPVVYRHLNLDTQYFVPFFIISRFIGWIAHINEQYSNNVLIRPRLNYIGATGKSYF